MTSAVRHVTFDCLDPYALGAFWAQVVGGHAGPPLLFEQVPDGKQVKNRVHLDLQPGQPRDEEVQRLVALGASLIDDRRRPDGTGWVVLADPEGNELCVERSAAERGGAAHRLR